MGHRAGFEPATSRVAGEVTEIFTTDRDGVGGERSMLLLPSRANRLSARRARTCSALSRLYHEVTDTFTTARPALSHRPLMGTYKILSRRCRRAACCEPFWVRSAIGVRLIASFPPAGPARLGTRLSSASPEIRVSRSGECRIVRLGRAAGNKKPSGAAGSGGSVRSGRSILRSGKIAPMSRACAIEQLWAIRHADNSFVAVQHRSVHGVCRKRKCLRGRGTYARDLRMSSEVRVKIAGRRRQDTDS